MEKRDVINLLKFLKEETEKYVTKKPYNLVEEADLQAFLYGKFSEYFDKKGVDTYFTDEDVDKNGEGKSINIYTIHCEYPRHVVGITDNGEEKLRCDRGRHDIVILRKPVGDEEKLADDALIRYPVDVAFELKLIWHDNTTFIRTDTVVNTIEDDLWVFGWDKKEGKFDLNPEGVKDEIVYPKTGVVFQVHLVKKGVEVKEELEDELWKIIKKRSEYKGNDLPDIFIVYIEIDRYNKKVIKSFIIPKK